LVIELSVLLRITASDYTFGVFIQFAFIRNSNHVSILENVSTLKKSLKIKLFE